MNTDGLMFPKGKPRKLEKADRLKARVSVDDRESAKVKARSGGRCEMVRLTQQHGRVLCGRRAVHVHHQLGGIGVRGRGDSALAENKVHACDKCHSDIHAHVLEPVRGRLYRRVR